jgi:hypothetical protein
MRSNIPAEEDYTMTKSRTAPMRPGIAKFLKRKIGGFVREYDKAVNAPIEPAPAQKPAEAPRPAAAPQPVKPESPD